MDARAGASPAVATRSKRLLVSSPVSSLQLSVK
jgi:hypothetical protein